MRGLVARLVVLSIVLAAGRAHADAPSAKRATAAAKKWMLALGAEGDSRVALAMTPDPFVFDHDAKACKDKTKAGDILACLATDTTGEVGEWSPTHVRVLTDASFQTWQGNAKRDVIEQHRKQLAKLKDHAFVHFDQAGPSGTYEIVLAVKVDADGDPEVSAFLANFLPAAKMPDLGAARQTASKFLDALGGNADARGTVAQRTGYPFVAIGLPHSEKDKSCKDELHATSAGGIGAITACVGGSKEASILASTSHTGWDVVPDVEKVDTEAKGDDNRFAASRDLLIRLSFDHLLLINHGSSDDDTKLDVIVAIRADGERTVVDAVIANVY